MRALIATLDPLLAERVREAAPDLEQLFVAEDGYEILEAVRDDADYAFAVVDLLLIGMDGLELLVTLRELGHPEKLLAVCPMPGTAMRAIRMGADIAIDRPLPAGKLEQALEQLLALTPRAA